MPTDFDGALLRGFLEAARRGSIGRAALALGQTQPALSQQIRRLEDLLGRPLLARSTQGVSLTPAGEAFLPYAERILSLSAEAFLRVAPRTGGRCRIGIFEDLAAGSGLPALLAQEAVTLVVDGSQAVREEFDAGHLDLMLGDPLPERPGLRARRRAALPLVWAAAPGFDAGRRPLALVLCRAPCTWRDRILETLEGAGIPWQPAVESGSLAALQSATAAGAGLAALLPAALPPGLTALDWRQAALPRPPEIEVALYRGSRAHGPALERLEGLVWEAIIPD